MLLRQTVGPSVRIVSQSDALRQLRMNPGDDDVYVSMLIDAAGAKIESMTGRAIMPQTWALSMNGATGRVDLPKVPVTTVSAIDYYDAGETQQSATVSDFYLYADDQYAWLEPKAGKSWPTVFDREDALTITFTAGYASVPFELQHAALMCIAYWDMQRSTVGEAMMEVPYGVQSLIDAYRIGWIAA